MSIVRTLVFAQALGMVTQAMAEPLKGLVVGVADGDTVTLLDADKHQHKIRLAGIDAPEKKQPYGQRSKESLSALVFQREAEVIGEKRDRYGRTVGKVMVADPACNGSQCPKTHDAGLMQIERGSAWWYRKYSREQTMKDRVEYEAAETLARTRRVGLWADQQPVPPWEWRHR